MLRYAPLAFSLTRDPPMDPQSAVASSLPYPSLGYTLALNRRVPLSFSRGKYPGQPPRGKPLAGLPRSLALSSLGPPHRRVNPPAPSSRSSGPSSVGRSYRSSSHQHRRVKTLLRLLLSSLGTLLRRKGLNLIRRGLCYAIPIERCYHIMHRTLKRRSPYSNL
jgi:hypothetical protein